VLALLWVTSRWPNRHRSSPNCRSTDEEDTVRMRQLVVRLSIVVDRVFRLVRIALGGKRVRRSGRKDHVVGRNRLARRHHDLMSADLYHPVTDHPPVGEEPVVRKEDLGQELRIDHGPERPDVVHERILGLDQYDLDLRVERLGDVDAPVATPITTTVGRCRVSWFIFRSSVSSRLKRRCGGRWRARRG
jgi:hypothetical protein